MVVLRALWFVVLVYEAVADYECVCNYNVEETIRNSPSSSASTIGYMYEFDCKQQMLVPSLDKAWFAVAFEHHLGYVQAGSAVQIQTCQGSPPVDDLVTTTTSTTSAPTTVTIIISTLASSTPTPTSTTSSTTQTSTTTIPSTTTTTTTTTLPSTTATTTTTTTTPTTQTTTLKPTTITSTSASTTTRATTATKPPTTTTQATTTTKKPTITTKATTTTAATTTTTAKTTKVTTHRPTTTTTPRPTTTLKPTTTPKQTTTSKRLTTQTPTTALPTTTQATIGVSSPCSFVSTHYQKLIKGSLTTYGQKCYEIATQSVAWPTAEHDCNSKGGHLVHIANSAEQNFIYNYIKTHGSHRVWIGLNDHRNEEKFEWTSGDPVTYTHWAPDRYSVIHIFEDCVELDPNNNGFWNDKDCNTVFQAHYGYVCQYWPGHSVPVTSAPLTHSVTTSTHSLDGNTNLCSIRNRQHAQTRGTILAQYGNSCYELMPKQKMTWKHAEQLCENGNGHLAHISNSAEQGFVDGLMQRHLPQHAAWIGLHDLRKEGHYEWTSGNAVSYTNFISNHLGNFVSRYEENCFAFIPYKNGQWDDLPCGQSGLSFDYGEIHPMICQFLVDIERLYSSGKKTEVDDCECSTV